MPTLGRPQQRSNSVKRDGFSYALLAYEGNAGQARAHLEGRTKTPYLALSSKSSTNLCSCLGRLPSRCGKRVQRARSHYGWRSGSVLRLERGGYAE